MLERYFGELKMRYTIQELEYLKQSYGKIATRYIAKKLNRTETAIRLKCNKLGLFSNLNEISNKKYNCNENFFNKPNIENSYWAGFIAADGNIHKNGKYLQIKLKDSDIAHLEKFKKVINFDGKVSIYQNGGDSKGYHCYLQLTSVKICKDLKDNFNITPRKSLTLQFPKNLTKNQEVAFIKGYFDGDGCIYFRDYGYTICFVGQQQFLKTLKNKLNKNINLNTKASILISSENCYRFSFSHKKARNFLKELAKLKTSNLDRKWTKYHGNIK